MADVTWSIAEGDLPTGMALDAATGAISGTPAVAADLSVVIIKGEHTSEGFVLIELQFVVKAPVLASDAMSAQFDSSGSRIIVSFSGSNYRKVENSEGPADACKILFKSVTHLGSGAKCGWISSEEIGIKLGSGATVASTDAVQCGGSVGASEKLTLNAGVVFPVANAIVTTPETCLPDWLQRRLSL